MAMKAKDALTYYRQHSSMLARDQQEFQQLSDAEKFELLFYVLMATNNQLLPLLQSMGIDYSTNVPPKRGN